MNNLKMSLKNAYINGLGLLYINSISWKVIFSGAEKELVEIIHHDSTKSIWTIEHIMLISLTYQSTGEPYSSMVLKFGGWYSSYTYPIHYFVNRLYGKYYHLISGQSLRLWTDHISTFREAIWKKIAFDEIGVRDVTISLENFRVFSFLDTISHSTCHQKEGQDTYPKQFPQVWVILF